MFDKKQSLKVKGLAVIMLVFHHMFYSEQRIQSAGITFWLMDQKHVMIIAACMRLCVWIFAFVSAYGLTVQYQKLGDSPDGRQITGFVYKRWVSLMRPYLVVFVLTVVLFSFMGKNPIDLFGGNAMGVLTGAFALSDLFGTKMPVAAWWYMCFAQILLLCIPVLNALCKKYGILVLIASFVILPYAGSGIVSPYGGYYYNYLFVVILGVLSAQNGWLDRKTEVENHGFVRLVEAVGLFVTICLCAWLNYRFAGDDTMRVTKLLLSAATLLVCVFVHQYLTWKPLETVLMYLGRYSGYIFLTHAFGYTYFQKLIFWSGNAPVTFAALFLFGLVTAIVCDKVAGLKWISQDSLPMPDASFSHSDTAVIKGVATLLLLAVHLFNRSEAAWSLFSYNPAWMVDGRPLISALVKDSCGKICVDLFVILSGYGLNHSFRSQAKGKYRFSEALRFSVNRAMKLMLQFWSIYIVFVGLLTLLGKVNPMATYGIGLNGIVALLLDFLGLQDILFEIFHTATVNPTWWYMSTVLLFYMLFPVLRYFVEKKGKAVPLVLLLLINITAPYVAYRQMKTGCFFYLAAFYLGMLLSELNLLDRMKTWIGRRRILKLLCGIPVLAGLYFLTYKYRYWGELPYALAWMYLCFALFVGEKGLLCSRYCTKPFELIGKHSGNIFMFHTFFLFRYPSLVYLPQNPVLIILWFTALSVIISVIFEFLLDKTGINTLKKKILYLLR